MVRKNNMTKTIRVYTALPYSLNQKNHHLMKDNSTRKMNTKPVLKLYYYYYLFLFSLFFSSTSMTTTKTTTTIFLAVESFTLVLPQSYARKRRQRDVLLQRIMYGCYYAQRPREDRPDGTGGSDFSNPDDVPLAAFQRQGRPEFAANRYGRKLPSWMRKDEESSSLQKKSPSVKEPTTTTTLPLSSVKKQQPRSAHDRPKSAVYSDQKPQEGSSAAAGFSVIQEKRKAQPPQSSAQPQPVIVAKEESPSSPTIVASVATTATKDEKGQLLDLQEEPKAETSLSKTEETPDPARTEQPSFRSSSSSSSLFQTSYWNTPEERPESSSREESLLLSNEKIEKFMNEYW